MMMGTGLAEPGRLQECEQLRPVTDFSKRDDAGGNDECLQTTTALM